MESSKLSNTSQYSVEKNADGSYSVSINGQLQDNAKGAMRQIADAIGFEYDPEWTTHQFGAKLSKVLNGGTVQKTPALEDVKIAEERARAEAAAAKAELAKIQAEAAKAKAEAEAAKAAAEKAKAEAAKPAPAKESSASQADKKGALPGLFSVAANKKVRFSKGNLQFNAAKYEFRFAEHQWDMIGEGNQKISSNYDGWIDLFGYGTSGYMGCQPYEHAYGETDYSRAAALKQYPQQDISNTNYDWGKYNPISNGGNKEGLWRTLTADEWKYLISKRANAEKLRAQACVNGVNGLLILPDDFFEKRIRCPYDSTPSGYSGNTYNAEQWKMMEENGAVFLPAAGCRNGTSLDCVGSYGDYWSSSFDTGGSAYGMDFASGSVCRIYRSRYSGLSVRPVSE